MDCSASASSAFGGIEVVWSGVGVASMRGGVRGRCVCASFGLLPVVLECGARLGSRSRWCVRDDASRRLSLCCTPANMSFGFDISSDDFRLSPFRELHHPYIDFLFDHT